MCEIVIQVHNKPLTGNSVVDARCYKQGDVIEVQADGFDWGPAVLGQTIPGNPNGNHAFWRLIKLPNVTVAQAQSMLSPELDVDPLKPSPYLQARAFFIDFSRIPVGALKNHWNDDTRSASFLSLPYTAAQLATLKTQRTPVPF